MKLSAKQKKQQKKTVSAKPLRQIKAMFEVETFIVLHERQETETATTTTNNSSNNETSGGHGAVEVDGEDVEDNDEGRIRAVVRECSVLVGLHPDQVSCGHLSHTRSVESARHCTSIS